MLQSFEAAFAAALLDRDRAAPAGLVARPAIHASDRFVIYRNNVFAGLCSTLGARFPVTRRLVGEAFFNFMAQEFIAGMPPTSPVLMEYGAEMPIFIDAFAPAQSLPYLPDVARLEWSIHEAAHGADAVPMSLAGFRNMSPAAVPNLRLLLHPTLAIFASSHPVVTIWRANIDEAALRVVPAGLPGEAALVLRVGDQVEVRILTAENAAFIGDLQAGATLGEAAGRQIDLTATLTLLFRLGAITGFETAPSLH